jgi:hypothetical protein
MSYKHLFSKREEFTGVRKKALIQGKQATLTGLNWQLILLALFRTLQKTSLDVS